MGSQILKKVPKSTSNFIFPKSIFDPKTDESIFFAEEAIIFQLKFVVLMLNRELCSLFQIWSNVFLSMACLVICMQVRHIIVDIQHRFMRHKEFCLVTRNMDAMFPEVRLQTPRSPRGGIVGASDNEDGDEDESEDTCAICWDTILVGRKLPCSHVFHR